MVLPRVFVILVIYGHIYAHTLCNVQILPMQQKYNANVGVRTVAIYLELLLPIASCGTSALVADTDLHSGKDLAVSLLHYCRTCPSQSYK